MNVEIGKLDFLVRPATKSDMKYVREMIQELADFEKMSTGPQLSIVDLERDGFLTNPPLFKCLIAVEADNDENRLGYAIYFNTYSTWEGKALMLEDLYVKPYQRKLGIGLKLFSSVAKEAVDTKCTRLDFHVLKWNKAREFYKKLGAANLTETEDWCYYRLSGDQLKQFSL